MRRDSTFCSKSVRYNIFTNGAPYSTFQRGLGLEGYGLDYITVDRKLALWYASLEVLQISLRFLATFQNFIG